MNTPSDNQAAAGATQKQRWFKYGLNVTVMVLAVIAIVVFINIIAYRSVRRSPWLRSDWTSTRQYSLSPQTLGLLGNLDKDVTVTTFYVKSDLASAQVTEQLQRVEDLLAEYQRRSGRVEVEQIDPAVDIEAREAFFGKLLTRYGDQIDTSRTALEKSKAMFDKVKAFSENQTRVLPEKVAQIGNADTQTTLLLRQLNQQFVLAGQLIEDIQSQVDRSLDQSLPDFSSARRAADSQLDQFRNFTNLALERFTAKTDDKSTPKVVAEALLDLSKEYKSLRDELATAVEQLKEASSSDYDQMRSRLQQNNSMIVGLKTPSAGGKDRGITVLTMDDIYPLQAGAQPGEGIQGYKGEEAITGAILKLTLTHKTHVVFVNPTQQPLLQQSRSDRGGQSTYNNVAERLRSMNFKVSEWRPGPQMGPQGRPMPPQPKPVAEPGETLIFVGVAEQQNPFANPRGPNPGQMVESAVSEHLKQGQPTLVFTAPKFNPGFGAAPGGGELAEQLKVFGIDVHTSRVVVSQRPGPGGRAQTTNQLDVKDWPDDHPAGRSVQGLAGVLIQALPVNLPADAPAGVTYWPLVTTGADTWADSEILMSDPQSRGDIKKDESDPAGPFTVAVAAEKGKQRLVLISDFLWARDVITSAARPALVDGGRRITTFAVFPGNAELFVNSVYWLAGLDELIAPGARTQDVRRIGRVSRPAMIAMWWVVLGALPVACLLTGGAVWFARRR